MWSGRETPTLLQSANVNNLLICRFDLSDDFVKRGFQVLAVNNPRQAFAVAASLLVNSSNFESRVAQGLCYSQENAGKDIYVGVNSVIHDCVLLGNSISIGDNVTIGGPGFGFVNLPNGNMLRMPHFGSVEIRDEVEIGSNVTIDRGTIGSTIIGKGTKIDNLVHVAHNVEVGDRTLIAACAEISGSCKIGNDVWIGPGVTISDGITIGDSAFIAIGSTVTRNIAPNERFLGAHLGERSNK
jgi:UDP-3-O-[3-hydroxymyristoyl] glucosamine N-acyltransferase